MYLLKKINLKIILISVFTALSAVVLTNKAIKFYEENQERKKQEFISKVLRNVKSNVTTSITNRLPKSLKVDDEYFRVDYSFDEGLETFIKKEIRRYRPDHASVVVIDNKTGKILSAVDFARDGNKFGRAMTFSATHPAASVFKIVTAADLIENHKMDKEKRFSINGRGTTLYKYQLKDKVNRWTRFIPFSSAFAFSNNPIFGKAAIKESSAQSLYQTAINLGFNRDLMADFGLGKSFLKFPGGDYELAEISSGFNRETLISPVHGAVLASVVANSGLLKKPHMVSALESQNFNLDYADEGTRVLSKDSAEEIAYLMERTIKKGTARGAFRRLKRKLKRSLDLGGKTGTITGGVPFGKRDWFVAYAVPKVKTENSDKNIVEDHGISLCVMMVNKKKWYVKSSYLARRVIEYYYRDKTI